MRNYTYVTFAGQPGTGKSFLAKAVANAADKATFMPISVTNIEDKFHGESEANVEAIFALARSLAPTILFIGKFGC